MPLIYVKPRPGRVVREAARGRYLKPDRFTAVQHTPYIDRMIHVWGDLEVQAKPPAPPAPLEDAAPALKTSNKKD